MTVQPQLPPQSRAAADPAAPGGGVAKSRTADHSAPIARTAAALLSVQGITWITSLANILIAPRFREMAQRACASFATTGRPTGVKTMTAHAKAFVRAVMARRMEGSVPGPLLQQMEREGRLLPE